MSQALPPAQRIPIDAVLLLGIPEQYAQQEAEQRVLPSRLAARLGLLPARCRLEFREQPALAAIEGWRTAGCRRAVVLPLTLETDVHQHEGIFGALDWERIRQPAMTIHCGAGLGVQPALVQALAAHVAGALATADATVAGQETAVLVIGQGSSDPENNAEITRLARLLWEGRPYAWVEAAYCRQTQPDIRNGLRRCFQLGARQIIVAPYSLYADKRARHIVAQVAAFQADHPTVGLMQAAPLAGHPGVIEAIAQQVAITATGQPLRQQRHSHHNSHQHQLSPAASFLPPRYRNGGAVSAAAMGAAPLVYDGEGRVAWEQIWGKDDPNNPFCALALAGGPPHRDKLLEPVAPDLVRADWAGYSRVVAELTRGIQLTTGLRTRLSQALGWIGVECHSEEMALWLLRAIVVENVTVRREGAVLYLPAGPAFRLEGEIKNVITALAKTHHYWQEHRAG